jgi:two-component sensor histidine kinase
LAWLSHHDRFRHRLSQERDQSAVLFKELQHRVANNLQFISSLFQWQRRTAVSDPANSAKALDIARDRLELMARIHRRLYDPESIRLPLGRYFEGYAKKFSKRRGRKMSCAWSRSVPSPSTSTG